MLGFLSLPKRLISASKMSLLTLFISRIRFTTTDNPLAMAALYAEPSPPFPRTSAAAFIKSGKPNVPLSSLTITRSPILRDDPFFDAPVDSFLLLPSEVPLLWLLLGTCTCTTSSVLSLLITLKSSSR